MSGLNWRRFVGAALVTAMAVSLAACVTSIHQIMSDPMRYRDREARISGRIVESFAAGPRGAYLIDDRTGLLWVLSDRGVPRRGVWVKVTGTIREGFDLGPIGERLRLVRGLDVRVILVEHPHRARF